MTQRTFIVGPYGAGPALGDTLHQVCQTGAHGSLFDIYMEDRYKVVESCGSLEEAKEEAKKLGAKRPKVL